MGAGITQLVEHGATVDVVEGTPGVQLDQHVPRSACQKLPDRVRLHLERPIQADRVFLEANNFAEGLFLLLAHRTHLQLSPIRTRD